MLHDPSDMSDIGRFRGPDVWHAALKAASRRHERILLRRTRTRIVHEFAGRRVKLEAPAETERAGARVRFEFRPQVEHVRSWEFATPLSTAEGDALGPPAAADPAERTPPPPKTTAPAAPAAPARRECSTGAGVCLRAPTRPPKAR